MCFSEWNLFIARECIISFDGLSDRVALLKITIADFPMSIIQVYAPTEAAKEEELKSFYETLDAAQELAGNNLIIMSDFNAKIGSPKPEEQLTMGKFGYGNRNDRGEILIKYALEKHLVITNTLYKKNPKARWTWISPDGKVKNERRSL